MKITKRQLRQIIKEEKRKLLSEMWGESIETGSDLIEFAKAYSGLGEAVSSQVDAIVAAYNNGGHSPEYEVVYEQNPNAIKRAYDKLSRILNMMEGEEAMVISEALEEAMDIFNRGDDEVEADARAAAGFSGHGGDL